MVGSFTPGGGSLSGSPILTTTTHSARRLCRGARSVEGVCVEELKKGTGCCALDWTICLQPWTLAGTSLDLVSWNRNGVVRSSEMMETMIDNFRGANRFHLRQLERGGFQVCQCFGGGSSARDTHHLAPFSAFGLAAKMRMLAISCGNAFASLLVSSREDP